MSAESTEAAAVTAAAIHPVRLVRVQDADRIREFYGYMMHRVSTEVAHKPQWLEIELWKFTDGTCRYLLHFTGRSVLVHTPDSDCNTGIPIPASGLHPDSESCRRCRPDFRNAGPDDIFEAETDRHKIEVCDGRPKDEAGAVIPLPRAESESGEPPLACDEEVQRAAWRASAREVIRVLRESWHRKPEAAGTLSAPAQRLVDTVARYDDAILAATQVVEKL